MGFILKNKELINMDLIWVIAKDFLNGLIELERWKIMHWDLKPENVLINKDFEVWICDFGSAKYCNGKKNSTFVVSMFYRAPELYLNYQSYDFRIDIWSFGCILAEMILHWPLFKTQNEGD